MIRVDASSCLAAEEDRCLRLLEEEEANQGDHGVEHAQDPEEPRPSQLLRDQAAIDGTESRSQVGHEGGYGQRLAAVPRCRGAPSNTCRP